MILRGCLYGRRDGTFAKTGPRENYGRMLFVDSYLDSCLLSASFNVSFNSFPFGTSFDSA